MIYDYLTLFFGIKVEYVRLNIQKPFLPLFWTPLVKFLYFYCSVLIRNLRKSCRKTMCFFTKDQFCNVCNVCQERSLKYLDLYTSPGHVLSYFVG